MAAQYGVQLLGSLPLDGRIRAEADGGRPSVVADPASPRALAYLELARHAAGELSRRSRDRSAAFPKIVVEDT
jgi:ATP-binding protein involved in chromosome partitioning